MVHGRVVAVIDVGSNSVRLLVARALSASAFEVIDEERFDARLAEGNAGEPLEEAAIERGLRALRLTTQVADSYGPAATVAVGTEALRRAPNSASFLDLARAETGRAVRVLTAREEAFASFLGVVNSMTFADACILDVGGGSVELMRVRGRAFVSAESVPLGALYATARFLHSDPPSGKEIRALRKAVRHELRVECAEGILIGVGGAVRNLARLARLRRKYPLRRLHGLTIERAEVTRIASLLARASADQRRRIPGVSAARSENLHAAAIVIDEVMAITGAQALTVAGQGLREGLVWQELRGEAAVLPDVRAASVHGLARANNVDEMAAEPVVAAAGRLFEVTRPAHGLGGADLDLLVTAARLAGIGMHIDYYNRDRHAEYLVHSGDLHGFSHREIVLLGALVRCADGGSPDLAPYRALVNVDDTRRVTVLSALLGTARAVRRRLPSPVLGFEASYTEGGALALHLLGRAPLDAELVALERQQKRLEGALRVPVVIAVRTTPDRSPGR